MSSPLSPVFTSPVLQLPDHMASRESYEKAIEKMGWTLQGWDELVEGHDFSPVQVKVTTGTGQEKDFVVVRTKNSATFAVVRDADNNGAFELLVREEQKATGESILTMPSGYPSSDSEAIESGALKKLTQETGLTVTDYVAVPHSAASLPNNSTNTSTSFIASVSSDTQAPSGWRFMPLEEAPSALSHLPAQMTATFACQYFGVTPKIEFVPFKNALETFENKLDSLK